VFDWSVQRNTQDDGSKPSTRRKVVQEEEDHRASDRMLRSHTRQAQQGGPGAVGQQRTGRGRDTDLW